MQATFAVLLLLTIPVAVHGEAIKCYAEGPGVEGPDKTCADGECCMKGKLDGVVVK